MFSSLVTQRDFLLVTVHTQLQTISLYIHRNGVGNVGIEDTRWIAHRLTLLGQALDDIEASVNEDSRPSSTSIAQHVICVMSFFYDVREVVSDLLT